MERHRLLRKRTRKQQSHHDSPEAASISPSESHQTESEYAVVELQRLVGNQGVQRLLAQGKLDSVPQKPRTLPPINGITAARRSQTVQRFGSKEHKELGDDGSGQREYNFSGPGQISSPNFVEKQFRLTHGDITMLSGDYFDPRDTTTDAQGQEQPVPDSLFRLAGIASSDPGKMVGTQDEIIYAIKKINSSDPRFQPASAANGQQEGVWASLVFSDAVQESVSARYNKLASVNIEHFASPTGKEGGPSSGLGASAGGSYRSLHEDAVLRAFGAGQHHGDNADAMAHEAAAGHFLTDNFAAGHLRSPRSAIRDYWRGKYPLFFGNLKKKIALDVARHINEHSIKLATLLGTVSVLFDQIYSQVQEKTANLPEIGFDHLVALVTHDMDNETGLWVTNDLGEQWKAYGDGDLHKGDDPNDPATYEPDNRNPEMAKLAVQLGVSDIQHAYDLGAANPGPISNEWVFSNVKAKTQSPAKPGDKYGSEQVIPRVDPTKENSVQSWQAASMDDLWTVKVRSDSDETFGSAITASMKSGEIKETLEGMADKFPEDEVTYYKDTVRTGTVHPKAAYVEGFLEPLLANPQAGLRSIIDYNPSVGQVFFNEDDAAREEVEGMSDKEIQGLTLNQRSDRIRSIILGTFNPVFEDDGELVIKLFETAPAAERAQLYRLVEGHSWEGDWIEGFFTDDDEIYNSLDSSQLSRLKKIINGN